jgi:hypothetical protein
MLNQTTRDWYTDVPEAPHRELHNGQQVYEPHVGQFSIGYVYIFGANHLAVNTFLSASRATQART